MTDEEMSSEELVEKYGKIMRSIREYVDEWFHTPTPFYGRTGDDVDNVLQDLDMWVTTDLATRSIDRDE